MKWDDVAGWGKVDRYKHSKRLQTDATYWDEYAELLFDRDPFWRDLSIVTEGHGDLTPFLMPPGPGPERDERAEACEGFEQRVAPFLAELEAADTVRGAALRARWQTWWADERSKVIASGKK